ncbi:MAG: glycosyltransferase family 39 protein [Bacteroidetes bacterium]|nr:glycosyltransferase family 39 protein [Bacteroidota bacterium]
MISLKFTKKNIIIFELTLIVFLSLVTMFYNLDKGSLADWDEAIYAEVSKEMLLDNDWVTLHYNSEPRFIKTPLFQYFLSIIYSLFGISTFTSRVLVAIFGLGTVLVTFFFSKELFNHKAAFISSLVLLSAPQFLHKSKMLMLDVPTTFFIVLSLYLFVLTQRKKSFFYLLGISLGCSVMMKGVVGLLPIFIIIGYLLLTNNIKSLGQKNYLKVLWIFLIIVVPWHLAQIILHGQDFINQYFFRNIIERVSVAIEQHNYGNLFYLKVLIHGLGAWFYALIAAIIYFMIKIKKKESKLILCWIIIIAAIFLIAKTKLPWYLIPLYPAFAIAIGGLLYNIKIKKVYLGVIIAIIIFIFSFHIPEPFYCNNSASNIEMIAGDRLKVHDSISMQPGELFYFGSERYKDESLLTGNFYTSRFNLCDSFSNCKLIYGEKYYGLFTTSDNSLNYNLLKEKISIIPKTQKEPERYCYAFMPMNLGIYYSKSTI